MSDPSSSDPSSHGGPHVHGGPVKIVGIRQSAADAQARRERYAQDNDNDNDADPTTDGADPPADDTDAGDCGSESQPHGAPHGIHVRGGPRKISAIMQSAQNGKQRREAFEQELADKKNSDTAADEDDEGEKRPRGPGPRFMGGPAKIQALTPASKWEQGEQQEATEQGENEE